MARVTQQRTRQMLLTTGDPQDPYLVPEKLQLFNELGEPLMIGSSTFRDVKIHTTSVLTMGQRASNTLEVYPGWRAYRIITNRPARVRLYATAAQRDADVDRAIGVKPTGNHGRLLEVVTEPGLLDLILSPVVDFTSYEPGSSDFYASITNLDTVTGAVVTTYHYVRTE